MKAGLEASVIPAFEMSCKAMFEQVDSAFRKGMIEHTTAAQQHFESAHSSLALALRVSILCHVRVFIRKGEGFRGDRMGGANSSFSQDAFDDRVYGLGDVHFIFIYFLFFN